MEEARENSYINETEIKEVVKRVKELANDWPVEWKVKDLSRIGVISAYTSQVISLVLLVCFFFFLRNALPGGSPPFQRRKSVSLNTL